MAKKSAFSHRQPPERNLAQAVERLTGTLSIIGDTLEQIRAEIAWIVNNRDEFRSNELPEVNLGLCPKCLDEHRSVIPSPTLPTQTESREEGSQCETIQKTLFPDS